MKSFVNSIKFHECWDTNAGPQVAEEELRGTSAGGGPLHPPPRPLQLEPAAERDDVLTYDVCT